MNFVSSHGRSVRVALVFGAAAGVVVVCYYYYSKQVPHTIHKASHRSKTSSNAVSSATSETPAKDKTSAVIKTASHDSAPKRHSRKSSKKNASKMDSVLYTPPIAKKKKKRSSSQRLSGSLESSAKTSGKTASPRKWSSCEPTQPFHSSETVTPERRSMETTQPTCSAETTSPSMLSPTVASSRLTWMEPFCYCGEKSKGVVMEGELNNKSRAMLLPTVVKPVVFDAYNPVDISTNPGAHDLSIKSLSPELNQPNYRDILPFLPILHGITYASRHAHLLTELIDNYEYFESNLNDSS